MKAIIHSSLLLIGIVAVAIALPDDDDDGESSKPLADAPKPCNLPVPMIYAPVCGSDGVVYSSKYELRAKNICDETDVTVVSRDQCPNFPARLGKRRKRAADDCHIPVPALWAPVCGSDGKMYDNRYAIRAKNICEGTSITVADASVCQGKRKRAADCHVPVPMIYMPVCGSDGRMYDNEYYIKARNQCDKTNIRVVDNSRCQRRKRRSADDTCRVPVPMIYMPVCGSNGVTYANKYLIRAKNTCDGTNIVEVDSSNCPDFPPGAARRG